MKTTHEIATKGCQASAPAIQRILVPTDLTPESEKAVQYGLTLAERFGGRLTLFFAYTESYASQYSRGPYAYDNAVMERNSCEEALRVAGAKLKERYAGCDTLFGYGKPDEEVVKAAAAGDFDLIVISTHHYNWLTRLAFGSDADQILHDAPCPILVLQVEAVAQDDLLPREGDLAYALGSLF